MGVVKSTKKTAIKKNITKKAVTKKGVTKKATLSPVDPQIVEALSHVKGFPSNLTDKQWRLLGEYLSRVAKEVEAKKSSNRTSPSKPKRSGKPIGRARVQGRGSRKSSSRGGMKIASGAIGAAGGAAAHAALGSAGLAIAGGAVSVGLAPFVAVGAGLGIIANAIFGD